MVKREKYFDRCLNRSTVKSPVLPVETTMPSEVNHVANPEAGIEESEMKYDWVQVDDQWVAKCTATNNLTHVRKVRNHYIKTLKSGRNRVDSKKVYYLDYESYEETECVEWQLERKCGAGKGMYRKQFYQGTCFAKEELVSLGNLWYRCPHGYETGTPGFLNFNSKCTCGQSCGAGLSAMSEPVESGIDH